MNMRVRGMSGHRGRRELMSRYDMGTTSGGIGVTLAMSPFTAIVAGTMECGP